MYYTIHPLIQALSFSCILAGFILPFLGYWNDRMFDLHLLALAGFFIGMSAGYCAALIREA